MKELTTDEARNTVYDIDNKLGKLWVDGFISSYDKADIMEILAKYPIIN